MALGIVTFVNARFTTESNAFAWGTNPEEHRFNPEFLDEFTMVLDEIGEDPSIVGLVVTAEGKYFSNGVDINYIKSRPETAFYLQKQVELLMARILTLNMLTICVLNGHTTAAGALLSLAFDFRYMGKRGFFFLPAVDLGIVYSHGMIELVKAKVTDPRIHRDLMILSKRYTSEDLVGSGVVDKITDSGVSGAVEFLTANAKQNKKSLHEIKRRMYHLVAEELRNERISDMHWEGVLRPKL